ncbi:hypothetical protein EF849_07155 [Aeromonas jandaei]|nr:hypothetical protein [Aeromonas jandaei]
MSTQGNDISVDIKHMFTTSERVIYINGTHLTVSAVMARAGVAQDLFPVAFRLHLAVKTV